MIFSEQMIRKMLPKTYLRKYVARQIFISMSYFKNLTPEMDEYVYKDGTTQNLMKLTGTIPVVFSGKTYNIPICVWIEPTYPRTPPMCYVKPTHEMIIVKGKYISSDGEVTIPYLKAWKKFDCDLFSLLQLMAVMFGESPPLTMRSKPDLEQASCWLEFNKEADGRYCMSLPRGDGQPFQHENETSC